MKYLNKEAFTKYYYEEKKDNVFCPTNEIEGKSKIDTMNYVD